MFKPLTKKFRKKFRRNRSGQAISEYAAIIAFVAVLILVMLTFTPGVLGPAISRAYSSTSTQLNTLAAAS